MTRGRGRQRKPTVDDIKPGTPEGKQLGLSDRVQGHPSPIPGGRPHLSNAAAVRHTVPTPASDPEIGMGNVHGVIPGSHTNEERAEAMRGPNTVHATMPRPQHAPSTDRPHPIPVYLVQDHDEDVVRSAAPRSVAIPGNGSDPVRLCGRDKTRTCVQILNESTAQDIRFAQRPSDLVVSLITNLTIGGALLPWPNNGYLKIETQDELYALSTSSTASTMSVIQVFEREM